MEQTERTLVNVTVHGGKGHVVNPETGAQMPAYFFVVDDPDTNTRTVVPLTPENKEHVLRGWSDIEIAGAVPPMAVPGSG